MTPAEEWAGRQYPGMEDPLRGLLLDHLLGRVRRALDGMDRSRAPAEARRRELEAARRVKLHIVYEVCTPLCMDCYKSVRSSCFRR